MDGIDYILNGTGSGSVAAKLLASNMDTRILQPWIGKDGKNYIVANDASGKEVSMVTNAEAFLRQDEWKLLDTAVVSAAKPRLKLVNDIRGRGLVLNVPGGMAQTVLQTETMGEIGAARVSMDGIAKGDNDRFTFDTDNMPLPIVHKDFNITLRQLLVTRNGGHSFDTTMAEMASRKVAELTESIFLGTVGGITYGGGTIYGLTNYPQRKTHTLTVPTAGGWTGATLVTQLLAMRQKLSDQHLFGPYVAYVSPAWDNYLDADYSSTKGDGTLRTRLGQIPNISFESIDWLSDYQIVLVQATSDVVRAIVSMDFRVLQWGTEGGMMANFKVMSMINPQIRSIGAQCGIVHGAV